MTRLEETHSVQFLHVFWHCPSAQVIWQDLRAFWAGLGLWRSSFPMVADDFKHAVFSLTLPATPPATATLVPSRPPNYDWATALYRVMADLWELQVLQCMQLIWRWRHQDDPKGTQWTAAHARSVAEHTLLSSVATVQRGTRQHEHASVLHRILRTTSTVATRPRPTSLPAPAVAYLLFFDGGSRGNPGPGGAGAVVVKIGALSAEATVCWSAAMSLADRTTTNNYAEYVGVVTGLRRAYSHGWTPLTVIGDSHLILRQLAHYRPPLSERLLPLYTEARLLADRLNIVAWRHHLRACNKMVDHAANVAMDSKCSLQTFHPSERQEWRGLDQFLQGDIVQWRASSSS